MHPNPPHPRGAVALLLPEPPWGHAVTLGPWMPARWLQRGGLTKIIPHPHAPRAGMKPTPRRHVSGGTWRVPMACPRPSRAQGSLGWPWQWGQWVPPLPQALGVWARSWPNVAGSGPRCPSATVLGARGMPGTRSEEDLAGDSPRSNSASIWLPLCRAWAAGSPSMVLAETQPRPPQPLGTSLPRPH